MPKKILTAAIRQKVTGGYQVICLETGTFGEGENLDEAFESLIQETNQQLRLLPYPGINPPITKFDFRQKRVRKVQ